MYGRYFSAAARAAIPFIELRQLTLRLGDGRVLLSGVSHTFAPGLTGIVGANGSGKSMLARAIAGLAVPDAGSIAVAGDLHYVAQSPAAHRAATVADVAGLGALLAATERMSAGAAVEADFELLDGRWTTLADFEAALQACGLPGLAPGDSAAHLSGGELTRVSLAGAFQSGADWLLLDEPSNHLDRAGRDWLIASLRAWPRNTLVISHDRKLLEAVDAIVELSAQGLCVYGGNYTLYRSQRNGERAAALDALAHARTERLNSLREQRERHDAQQSRAARNSRAGKDANMPAIVRGKLKSDAQASAGRDAVHRAETRDALDAAVRAAAARVQPAAARALLMPGTAVPAGRRVFAFESAVPPWRAGGASENPRQRASVCHDVADTWVTPLVLTLAGPARLAITGPNGCGKSTLLRMLAGEVTPREGSARALVPFAWLDQHASALQPGQSVLDALRDLDSPLQEGTLRSHLALLGLGPAAVSTPVGHLSGGEKLKAALACALWRKEPAQLLLLDEPTNHLDLASTDALEQALKDYPGAMAIVSHDRRFLQALQPTHELSWVHGRWQLTER
ncbi:ABC-F family ATP-binding cassette domain-containing protein [Pseudoduganella sp. UC29_106]|uniref:ABC-F family ATP-binding cassette domain-containing protein n=1 Tax=Pseudoduganella sp. UC29_106 TaxID=3374553 RepID=UPI00375760AD